MHLKALAPVAAVILLWSCKERSKTTKDRSGRREIAADYIALLNNAVRKFATTAAIEK